MFYLSYPKSNNNSTYLCEKDKCSIICEKRYLIFYLQVLMIQNLKLWFTIVYIKELQNGIYMWIYFQCPSVRPSVRPYVRTYVFKSRKTKQQKTLFATCMTMGLAEWIIDDTCLVLHLYKPTLLGTFWKNTYGCNRYWHHKTSKILAKNRITILPTRMFILCTWIKMHFF